MNQSYSQSVSESVILSVSQSYLLSASVYLSFSHRQNVIKRRKKYAQSSPNLPSGSTAAVKSHLTSQSRRDEPHVQIVLHYILPFCVVLHWRQAASRLSSRGSILQKESLSLAAMDKSTADWLWTKGFSLNFKAAENFMSNQLAQKAPKSRAKSGTSRGADECVSFLKLHGINVAFRKTSISCSRQSTWL